MHISLQGEFKKVAANLNRDRKSTNQESHSQALLSCMKQRRCQENRQKCHEGNLERKLGAPDSISRNVKEKTKKKNRGGIRNRRELLSAEKVSCRLHRGKERVNHFYYTLNSERTKSHTQLNPQRRREFLMSVDHFRFCSIRCGWMDVRCPSPVDTAH